LATESNVEPTLCSANACRCRHAGELNIDSRFLHVDVLAVEMPSAPQERRLYGQLLLALNARYRPGGRLAASAR